MYQTVTRTSCKLLTTVTTTAFPQPQELHASTDLTVLFTISGFLLLLIGLGCLELVRKKRRRQAAAFCCLLPIFIGLLLAPAPALTAWRSRKAQKAAVNAYLAYAASMEGAAAEQAYQDAAIYNLALAEGRGASRYDDLPNADFVIASLELPAIGQTLPVYPGTGTYALQHGVGLLPESSLPIGGIGTHAVFIGCSGLLHAELFTDLDVLREGNILYIHILDKTLAYWVDMSHPIAAADISFPITPDVDQITLVTSYENGAYFMVHGVRVAGDEP